MSKPVQRPRTLQILEFAEFEVDLRTRELRRNRDRVHLQDQPFNVLAVLLEHAGEVVTREQLRQHLWSPDTFVDFDNSLNTAINKIREALGDSAENPYFVETLPHRGYRFIAPVNGASAHVDHTGNLVTRPVPLLRVTALIAALAIVVGIAAVGIWRSLPTSSPRIVGSKQLTNDGLTKIFFLVTDGSRIYFNEVASGRITLNQVSTAGGETAVINTTVPDPVVEDISPEHSHLLVQSAKDQWDPEGSDFWLVPLPAGSPRRLEGIIGRFGGWVPIPNDKFYFLRGNDIYVADHDGRNPRRIATAPGSVDYIQCSPDGSRLRFMIFDLGKSVYSTWEVRPDGSGLRPLLPEWNDPPGECCGRWTPDGRYYFFQDIHRVVNLWVMPDRNGLFQRMRPPPVQLTAGPLSFYFPISSKDGKQLYAVGSHGRGELVRYERKSGNFAPFLGGISVREVDFSRDGKWMAYVRYSEGDLWIRGRDNEPHQLTFPPEQVASVRWSPDGRQIAFSSITAGGTWKVRRISRDGGPPGELTKSRDLVEVAPDWSPNGETLAFGAYPPGRPDQSSVQLLDLKTYKSYELPGSEGLCTLRWSPNGRYLIAAPIDGKKLALFDFETKKWRELIANIGTIGHFSWSSDGAYVYFDDLFTNDPAYSRIRIRDSKVDRIASLKGIQRSMWNLRSPWSGLGPGEIPLFVHDISNKEIYALDLELP